jgi:hypothetical protein
MDWKGFGKKRALPNVRYYSGIYLEGPKKTSKKAVRTVYLLAEI